MPQRNFQLQLPEAELELLKHRISADHESAKAAHQTRMDRFVEYYQRWRTRYTPNPIGEEDKPNFRVPLTKWSVYTRWADEVDQLFGDDAEVIAEPIGPTDERNTRKVSRYMTWRFLKSIKATRQVALFIFRKILFGRSHVYMPWDRDTFTGSGGQERVHYEGPRFIPLWPDDLWLPAEDAETIHDFRFVIRKYWETPNNMLRREANGYYNQGVRQKFEQLLNQAKSSLQRDDTEPIKDEKDAGEGVTYSAGHQGRQNLRCWEWSGYWRMLKGKKEVPEDDLNNRELLETELVVRFEPQTNLVLSVQRLEDLYPNFRFPRPYAEASIHPDGSYWPGGFGEMLKEIEQELTINHNIGIEGGQLAAGPIILYEPASGYDPDEIELRPRIAIPVANAQGAKVVSMTSDLKFTALHAQSLLGYAERVSAVTDLNLGRSQDRPNAPRTLGQTALMQQATNNRTTFDTRMLREDMSTVLQRIYDLDSSFGGADLFFRVTEEEATGLFATESKNGFLPFDSIERGLRFDFQMKFATPSLMREAQRERDLALYQIDLQNPLIIQNPRAIWQITNRVHHAFGDSGFERLVPEPPDIEPTISPNEELARLQGGEEIQVRPLDNDQDHMIAHDRQMRMLSQAAMPDQRVMNQLHTHYLEHIAQLRQKRLMEALLQRVTENMPALLDQLAPALEGQKNGQGQQPGGQNVFPMPGQRPQGFTRGTSPLV